jgi:uncharacterized protein
VSDQRPVPPEQPRGGAAHPDGCDRFWSLLGACRSALVAFSGGTDSTLLLASARDTVPGRVLAVTIRSALSPAGQTENAQALANQLDADHRVIDLPLLDEAAIRSNPEDRCYHCKRAILTALTVLARSEELACVLEGTTADELGEHRPGWRAVRELGVLSPFVDAGMEKADVRKLARTLGLPNWAQPSDACLASRIPYGVPLDEERLRRIAWAESALKELGLQQVRLRAHGEIARLELHPNDLPAGTDALRVQIAEILHLAGFRYATLDLDGFRSGSLAPGG